jgi:hypothetical protein
MILTYRYYTVVSSASAGAISKNWSYGKVIEIVDEMLKLLL